ncbi:MAG: tetratricopeptide repeat protein [Candidatus Omnitrophota bacterium]
MRCLMHLLTAGCLVLSCCGCATERLSAVRASRSYSRYVMGALEERVGNIEEALEHYRAVEDLDQKAPAPHIQLGLSYIRLNKYSKAAVEFQQAVDLTPNDPYARYALALLYVQLGETKKAIDQYQVLLGQYSDERSVEVQLRRILSQLYFLEKDFAEAHDQCAAILKFSPLDEFALYTTALIYVEEDDVANAVAAFREVLTNYPESVQAMNGLAYLYAEKDINLDKALGLAEKAVEADSTSGAYVDTLGWVYFKMGETDRAIALLTKAARLELDPVIINHLAEAYAKKGLINEAREQWKASLALDPTQKDVRRRLKENKP